MLNHMETYADLIDMDKIGLAQTREPSNKKRGFKDGATLRKLVFLLINNDPETESNSQRIERWKIVTSTTDERNIF